MSADISTASPVTWVTHLAAVRAFRTLATELGRHSIPVLPVKGVVTARALYDDLAVRPIRDVDVRVRRKDFPRAVRVARDRGWHRTHVALLGQAQWRVEGMEVDVKSELG